VPCGSTKGGSTAEISCEKGTACQDVTLTSKEANKDHSFRFNWSYISFLVDDNIRSPKTSSDQYWAQSNHPSVSLFQGRLFSAVLLPVPSLPENTVDGLLSIAVCPSLPGHPSAIPLVGKTSVDLELS